MEFQISKNKILQAVNIVKQGVANRTTNPILKTILIDANEDGWLTLRATNSILDISAQVKAEVKNPGRICVSDLVINTLSNFNDSVYEEGELTNPVKFVLTDKSLTVSQGKSRHRPVFVLPDEFPKRLEIDGYVEVEQENISHIIEAFQRLQVSVGVTEDRRILQAFNINPHLSTIVTGDGTRVSLRENISLSGNIANPPAKLIMTVLSNLTGLGQNDKLEIKTGSLVAFKASQFSNDEVYLRWEVVVNGLDGDFPSKPVELIKSSLEKNPVLNIKVAKEKLLQILKICKVYSDRAFDEGKSQHVTLTKNGKGVVLSMHVPDLVEMEEPLECESEGEEFKFLFHPGMTLEALNSTKADNVEFRFYGSDAPFLMLDGSDFIYLQAAMKTKENKKEEE